LSKKKWTPFAYVKLKKGSYWSKEKWGEKRWRKASRGYAESVVTQAENSRKKKGLRSRSRGGLRSSSHGRGLDGRHILRRNSGRFRKSHAREKERKRKERSHSRRLGRAFKIGARSSGHSRASRAEGGNGFRDYTEGKIYRVESKPQIQNSIASTNRRDGGTLLRRDIYFTIRFARPKRGVPAPRGRKEIRGLRARTNRFDYLEGKGVKRGFRKSEMENTGISGASLEGGRGEARLGDTQKETEGRRRGS